MQNAKLDQSLNLSLHRNTLEQTLTKNQELETRNHIPEPGTRNHKVSLHTPAFHHYLFYYLVQLFGYFAKRSNVFFSKYMVLFLYKIGNTKYR